MNECNLDMNIYISSSNWAGNTNLGKCLREQFQVGLNGTYQHRTIILTLETTVQNTAECLVHCVKYKNKYFVKEPKFHGYAHMTLLQLSGNIHRIKGLYCLQILSKKL